ncbi:hypothetical protein KIPB_012008 [Kipferlia bialata]|uniref:Uncharacterized protein n=1 Tax=Kipferlia bialata TaxID=797122 RepID=A0A9K3D8A6_9EUKA|nr:hypothetical protein KIPB_012008 [Kipferlia bialata]|eukprot:g12008.t1
MRISVLCTVALLVCCCLCEDFSLYVKGQEEHGNIGNPDCYFDSTTGSCTESHCDHGADADSFCVEVEYSMGAPYIIYICMDIHSL